MRMRSELLALALLAACATPVAVAEREPFNIDALEANANDYVASRYARTELPAALIADLTAAGFECQHSASASQCSHFRTRTGNCFYSDVVEIRADGSVTAQVAPRCMGVLPPVNRN